MFTSEYENAINAQFAKIYVIFLIVIIIRNSTLQKNECKCRYCV